MKKSRQLAIDIINLFEDVLEQHNIVVPDSDRPEDNYTPLYGTTYGNLVDEVEDMIWQSLEVHLNQLKDVTVDLLDATSNVVSNFERKEAR